MRLLIVTDLEGVNWVADRMPAPAVTDIERST